MGDSRRIDFLAERDRRSGGENYVGDKENTVDYGGEHAQYEIPEYLKILYGAEAADVARADESNGAAYVEEVLRPKKTAPGNTGRSLFLIREEEPGKKSRTAIITGITEKNT